MRRTQTDPLCVVIVDDNPDDRSLIRRVLAKEFPGCFITDVPDAPAWEAVVDDAQIQVVITDYHLRWSDGLTIDNRQTG